MEQKNCISIRKISRDQFLQEYTIEKEIGQGSSSTVYKATEIQTKNKCALKQIQLFKNQEDREYLIHNEIMILQKLNQRTDSVIRLFDVFLMEPQASQEHTEQITYYMVLQYCKYTLNDYITDERVQKKMLDMNPTIRLDQLNEALIINLLRIVNNIHREATIHRDLKPDNIMFRQNGNLVIIDLGFGKYLGDDQFAVSYCGTPLYMAPELIMNVSENRQYGYEIDVFATGMMIFEIWQFKKPFEANNIQQLIQCLKQGINFVDTNIPQDLKDLILNMTKYDPQQRITFSFIYKHPFVKKHLGSELLSSTQNFYQKKEMEAGLIESINTSYSKEKQEIKLQELENNDDYEFVDDDSIEFVLGDGNDGDGVKAPISPIKTSSIAPKNPYLQQLFTILQNFKNIWS